MKKIWQSDCLAIHKEKFDESNTILIDKEEIGVFNHQENALILKKFEESDVKIQSELYQAEDVAEQNLDQGVLRIVKTDLFTVFDKRCEDVRILLKKGFTNYDQELKSHVRFSTYLRKVSNV